MGLTIVGIIIVVGFALLFYNAWWEDNVGDRND